MDAKVCYNKGLLFEELNQKELALELWDKAIEVN